MRIALLSDIHGHFGALKRAWRQALAVSDRIACLGDIVDGRGQDDECVEWIRRHEIPCVGGNHDQSCFLLGEPALKPENRRFLEKLPRSLVVEGLTLVHDNPIALDRPKETANDRALLPWRHWRYVLTADSAGQAFREASLFRAGPRVVAVGHTHRPAVFGPEGEATLPFVQGLPLKLDRSKPWIINPGSVGRPRFPMHGATFGVFDAEAFAFEVHPILKE